MIYTGFIDLALSGSLLSGTAAGLDFVDQLSTFASLLPEAGCETVLVLTSPPPPRCFAPCVFSFTQIAPPQDSGSRPCGTEVEPGALRTDRAMSLPETLVFPLPQANHRHLQREADLRSTRAETAEPARLLLAFCRRMRLFFLQSLVSLLPLHVLYLLSRLSTSTATT